MNMMRDEENAKYRSVIKNTLEFDPDIMKRYVNFMSNPDERTAIDQFGKGDKCFGVAAVMATLPGLPMFGHGQIEGFTEKYGMEYQWPRYEENADHWLVERHEREIAPLLHRRWLFAESRNFLLYDFFEASGSVDENVFAYSNRKGGERALVVYNNRYGTARGTIDFSAAYADKGAGQLRQQRLCEGLGVTEDSCFVLAFRDSLTGLEYLRRALDVAERGLTLDLHAYQCHVFMDWRELRSTAEQPWDRLCDQLNGNGVASLDDALVNLELRPVHEALRLQLDPALVRQLASVAEQPRALAAGPPLPGKDRKIDQERSAFFELAWKRCETFLRTAETAYASRLGQQKDRAGIAHPAKMALLAPVFRERLRAAMRIPAIEAYFAGPWTVAARRVLPSPSPQLTATAIWGPVLGWCALELLAESIDPQEPQRAALDLFDRLRLREPFAHAFGALGFEGEEGWRVAARIKVLLLTSSGVLMKENARGEAESTKGVPGASEADAQIPAARLVREVPSIPKSAVNEKVALSPKMWLDPDVRWLTGVHEADGHSYLVREPYEEMLWWLLMPSLIQVAGQTTPSRAVIEEMSRTIEEALATAESAGYRIDTLLGKEAAPETDTVPEPVAIGKGRDGKNSKRVDRA
jgi:hypothetical protein